MRRRLLFVDDSKRVRVYTRQLGKKFNQRHAWNAREAEQVIAKRLKAIERLRSKKLKQYKASRNLRKKDTLKWQIRLLEELRSKPFDLVVLGMNMLAGKPTGMALLKKLRKKFPQMSLVVHSGKTARLKKARRIGAGTVERRYAFEKKLEDVVMRKLGFRGLSLGQLEKSARIYPQRETMLGLKFPSRKTFVAGLSFVTAATKMQREEGRQLLFSFVVAKQLSANTFKALLRCKRRPGAALRDLTLNRKGKVVKRAKRNKR